MTYILIGSGCFIVGLTLGVVLIGLMSMQAYDKGYEDCEAKSTKSFDKRA